MKSTKYGTASLVLGILGLCLVFMPYIALPLSILAIVFSAKQKKIERTGTATSGLVLGIIGTVVNAMMLLILVMTFYFLI